MSTKYMVQHNAEGFWKDWLYSYNLGYAVEQCDTLITSKTNGTGKTCDWRVVRQETVQIYPQGIAHEQH